MARTFYKTAKAGAQRRKRSGVWIILFFIVTCLIVGSGFVTARVDISEGDIAPEDIYYSGSQAVYQSDILTAASRGEAASAVTEVYKIDNSVLDDFNTALEGKIAAIAAAKANPDASEAEVKVAIKQLFGDGFSDAMADAAFAMTSQQLNSYAASLKQLVRQAMLPGVTQSELEIVSDDLASHAAELGSGSAQRAFLKALYLAVPLSANKEFDPVATAAELENLLNAVEPVQVTVQPGQRIVERGTTVSAEQIEALSKLGMLSVGGGLLGIAGVLLMVAVIYLLLLFYLSVYRPSVRDRESDPLLVLLIFNVFLLLAKAVSFISLAAYPTVNCYLIPIAAAAMLLGVLQGRKIAIIATVLLSLLVGLVMNGQLVSVIISLVGGLTGIFCLHGLRGRNSLAFNSFYLAAVNIAVVAAWGFLYNQSWQMILAAMLAGLINAAASSILTLGLLPFLESVFHITTTVRLLELANSNNPLLKRLIVETPGTYNHSVLVGNLAEAAATEVGAEPILVRVAAYYHDVGKLKRPYFYIENQRKGDNPHDKMQPTLSSLVIISHVKDGIEMLREAHIPDEVLDIVQQHHGDSVLTYFYRRACDLAEDQTTVKKEDFAYPGPRPQSKEAALVMLADSVQAAVQALTDPDRAAIEQRVRDVIKQKLETGQLEECALTFRDLNIITRSFVKTLSGLGHKRMDYHVPLGDPDALRDNREREAVADDNKEAADGIFDHIG